MILSHHHQPVYLTFSEPLAKWIERLKPRMLRKPVVRQSYPNLNVAMEAIGFKSNMPIEYGPTT